MSVLHLQMFVTVFEVEKNDSGNKFHYLHKHCKHNVVNDLIDVDPDRSMAISYCTICESTL